MQPVDENILVAIVIDIRRAETHGVERALEPQAIAHILEPASSGVSIEDRLNRLVRGRIEQVAVNEEQVEKPISIVVKPPSTRTEGLRVEHLPPGAGFVSKRDSRRPGRITEKNPAGGCRGPRGRLAPQKVRPGRGDGQNDRRGYDYSSELHQEEGYHEFSHHPF